MFTLDGIVLSSKHRLFKKNFETEMWVNNIRVPLNNYIQETLANMILGFSKTLKQVEGETLASIEIRIKRIPKQDEVDAHTYP